MNVKELGCHLSCIFLVLIATSVAHSQITRSEELRDVRVTMKMDRESFGKVMWDLMTTYDIAIGFEESVLDRDHSDYDFQARLPAKPETIQRRMKAQEANHNAEVSVVVERYFPVKQNWISINAQNTRLEDVLDSIVSQMENYSWEINDGVVNIFPVRGRDTRYEALLNLNIKRFRVFKGNSSSMIRSRIRELPEFKEFLAERGIHSSAATPGEGFGNVPLSDEFEFSNVSFRDLLNKITVLKRGGWVLRYKGDPAKEGKEYIEILI